MTSPRLLPPVPAPILRTRCCSCCTAAAPRVGIGPLRGAGSCEDGTVATRACGARVDAHGMARWWMCCGAWRDRPCGGARQPARVEVLLARMAARPAVKAVDAGSEDAVACETEAEVDRSRRRSGRRGMRRCDVRHISPHAHVVRGHLSRVCRTPG